VLITSLNRCEEFPAGDHTQLRELLHPSRVPIAIRYSLAHGRLEPGRRSKLHRLASSEVYYFLAGRGVLEFLCLVDPAWTPQDEDVIE